MEQFITEAREDFDFNAERGLFYLPTSNGRADFAAITNFLTSKLTSAYQLGKEEERREVDFYHKIGATFWLGYDQGVQWQIERKYLSPEEADKVFSLLTNPKT